MDSPSNRLMACPFCRFTESRLALFLERFPGTKAAEWWPRRTTVLDRPAIECVNCGLVVVDLSEKHGDSLESEWNKLSETVSGPKA